MTYFNEADDCPTRWQSIIHFVQEWTGQEINLNPDDACVTKYQNELNLELPLSLKYWISFSYEAERIKDYFSYRDCLEVKWWSEHQALSILLQGEDDYFWAIQKEDLNKVDPPIYAYFLDHDATTRTFIKDGLWSTSISSFALNYLFSYFNPKGGSFSVFKDRINVTEADLLTEFPKKETFGEVTFYYNENILLYSTNNEIEWCNESWTVFFKTPLESEQVSVFVRSLYEKAHIKWQSVRHNHLE